MTHFSVIDDTFFMQQKELIQLKREAKLKGGFYVDPEAKLLFIIRIRGYALKLFIFVDTFTFILMCWFSFLFTLELSVSMLCTRRQERSCSCCV